MTKEEVIENIKLIRFNAAITNANSFKEALDIAIEALSQPSLPSNLDEAANDYCSAYYDWDNEGERKEVVRTFKAGAEWMAGQGVTKEAVIGMATEEIFINVSERTLDKLDLRPGDKVVVQIRKK